MKIGIIAPLEEAVSTNRFGGTERIIGHIADGLVDRGHQVTLFASGSSSTSAKLVSVSDEEILHFSQRDKDSVYAAYFLKLLREEYDVELWSNHLLTYPLAFASKLSAPMVTTVHSESLPARLSLMQEASYDSTFVAISDNQQGSFPGVNFAKRIYNGTDPDQLTYGDGGDYLVWLGRFSPKKGASEAVQAAIKAKLPLKLAGELPDDPLSPDRKYFAEHIEPYLSDEITYVGRVDLEAKRALLQNARALLSPLSWPEPFGLVAIEAMSCGTPVITTKVGAMPELVIDGETGYLLDDFSTIDTVIQHTGSLDRRKIRQHVIDHFSVTEMVSQYEELYDDIIKNNQS